MCTCRVMAKAIRYKGKTLSESGNNKWTLDLGDNRVTVVLKGDTYEASVSAVVLPKPVSRTDKDPSDAVEAAILKAKELIRAEASKTKVALKTLEKDAEKLEDKIADLNSEMAQFEAVLDDLI